MSSDEWSATAGAGTPAPRATGGGHETPPRQAGQGRGLRRRLRRWLRKRHEVIKNYAQVAAIMIAALWGIYVFVYENIYRPSKEEPDVIISARLEEGGRARGLVAVKATARNVGKRLANVLGAWFNVEGFKINGKDGAYVGPYKENVESQVRRRTEGGSEIDMNASRYSDYDEANAGNRSYVFSTNFLLNRSQLETNEEDSKVVTFFVPEKDFDLVRVILHVVYIRDDRFVRREWVVDDDGQLRLVRYIKACGTCAEEEFNPADEAHRALGRKYGMAHTQSVVDLPLWEKDKNEAPNLQWTPFRPPPSDADAERR
jgi:hypothetical protein